MKQDRAGTIFVCHLADWSWGSRWYRGVAGSYTMLQWIEDRTRLWWCTVQLARFDSLDFAPPAHVPCQGPHAELHSRRAERRRSLTSIHATPSPGGHAAWRRPRSSIRGRTPKPPRGPPALQVARPARGRQSKAWQERMKLRMFYFKFYLFITSCGSHDKKKA